ncbi:MAG: hypothetical protein RLZZ165_90 [Bacteroidota bacterium]
MEKQQMPATSKTTPQSSKSHTSPSTAPGTPGRLVQWQAKYHEVAQAAQRRVLEQGAVGSRMTARNAAYLQLKEAGSSSAPSTKAPENKTGMPDNLKSGIERLSGLPMDDVTVHFNSSKPAQLQAHAYAQGTDIHLAPGQEKHLAHEAWHVVQQKQGRVKPTTQMKGTTVPVNDDAGLEQEADVMGAKALVIPAQMKVENGVLRGKSKTQSASEQKSGMLNGEKSSFQFVDNSPEANAQRKQQAAINNGGQAKVMQQAVNPIQREGKEHGPLTKEDDARLLGMDFANAYDGTLAGLARALKVTTIDPGKAGPGGQGSLSDNVLLDILIDVFERNWFKAKKVLTTDGWPGLEGDEIPPHQRSIALMQALVNMRGRVWTEFATKTMASAIKPELEKQKYQQDAGVLHELKISESASENFGLKDSVGSESVTSDIDLSASGSHTEIGLAVMNREFRAKFGTEPGAFFDINIYSSDWMFGGDGKLNDENVYTVTPKEEEQLSDEGKKKKDDQNEVWSMVKIRRNMTPLEWASYTADILKGLEGGQAREMQKKFDLANHEYTIFRQTVDAGVRQAEEALHLEEQLNEQSGKERRKKLDFADAHGHDEMAHEALEMQISNRKYEETVLKVKKLRLHIAKLKEMGGRPAVVEALALELHNEISRGLTYANEVYATQGAVLHTVYGKQGATKKLKAHNDSVAKGDGQNLLKQKDGTAITTAVTEVKYLLSKEMYLQSVNENVGDVLHSLNHNIHDPQYAVYRAGKYADRLCEAVRELVGEDKAKSLAGYDVMLTIGENSVKEKADEAGKDPMATHKASSYFSAYDIARLGTVRSSAMSLGAAATAAYKNGRKG